MKHCSHRSPFKNKQFSVEQYTELTCPTWKLPIAWISIEETGIHPHFAEQQLINKFIKL